MSTVLGQVTVINYNGLFFDSPVPEESLMLSVSSLLQPSFDPELLAELCFGSRVSFPSCPLALSLPLRRSVVRVPLLLLSVITYRVYTWMSRVLGQVTVINYNGLFSWLTCSRGVIYFISVFIVATISQPGAVARTVLWLKGFMSIMSAGAFTTTATISGQGDTVTLICNHV